MEEVTHKRDMPEWSEDEQKQLLNKILALGGNHKRSHKAVEASIKWDDVRVDGRSADDCKQMYQKLISKVRKYRTVQEIISDVFSLITEGKMKTVPNELPDMPKKPLTAFNLFVRKQSKKFPDVKGTNRMKVFANDWNELSEEKKEAYRKKYMKRKRKYEEELENFKQNHPEYQAASVASTSRPQPPLPSKLFVESRLEKLKIKQPELSNAEAVKKLMTKYKNLSDKKKLKWIKKARDYAQTYQDQCEQYLANKPKSNAKLGVFHLSKEEQRIWHSSKGKPASAPPKNLFMYFCQTRRDALHHLPISEQSKELSAIYHSLTEHELKYIKDKYKQEVEEYINAYTQYYLSLSEEEKSHEKAPEDALAAYNKILQEDKKKKKKKKKKAKENSVESDQKYEKQRLQSGSQRDGDVSSHDDSEDSSPSDEEVTSTKRKREQHLDAAVSHKKQKSEHEMTPSPSERKIDTPSPSTSTSVNNDGTVLSMWAPFPEVTQSTDAALNSDLHASKSKTPRTTRKSRF